MSDDREYLTEEEARRLWQRAAQLQAEAASRAEALESGRRGDDSPSGAADRGYALAHVRAAAIEAGIGAEFVDAALADVRAGRAALERPPGSRTFSRRVLGDPREIITVSRLVRAPPRRVLGAMEAVLPHDPFKLTLLDRRGDPLDGGVLTFEIEGGGELKAAPRGFAGDLQFTQDLNRLHIVLTPEADGSITEMTVRGPVTDAWPRVAAVASLLTILGGGAGLGAGYGIAAVAVSLFVATPVPAIAGVVCMALGLGGGARLSLAGARAIYRHGQMRDERALDTLVSAVAARAEGGVTGWFPAEGAPESPRISGPGGASPLTPSPEGDQV